jgi:hypothetical protein
MREEKGKDQQLQDDVIASRPKCRNNFERTVYLVSSFGQRLPMEFLPICDVMAVLGILTVPRTSYQDGSRDQSHVTFLARMSQCSLAHKWERSLELGKPPECGFQLQDHALYFRKSGYI